MHISSCMFIPRAAAISVCMCTSTTVPPRRMKFMRDSSLPQRRVLILETCRRRLREGGLSL
jgi:hypothetical protein